MAWRPDHLLCGVTYLPAEVGPYLWHEFDAARTARDLARIRRAGFGFVRVPLAWDAFVPSPRQVNRYRLRDLESLLLAAQGLSLQVVPVLFAQSFGDVVLLPRYAVARDRARPGVRVVSDGVVERGGPRDVWSDPLMLEVESLWLEEMLRAFSNHPALLAWDLGHDPATTCRPLRIAHLAAWAEMMGSRVRATQDVCWMTMGAGDVLTARGVRLDVVAPHVDALGMLVQGDEMDVARVLFVLRVAQRLSNAATLVAVVSNPFQEGGAPVSEADAVRHAGALLEQAPGAGVAALVASAWTDLGPRLLEAPPYDRAPWLAHTGLATPAGDVKPEGEVWSAVARRDIGLGPPNPWPNELDAASWYEELPDASNDLFASFRAETDVASQ